MIKLVTELVVEIALDDTMESLAYSYLVHMLDIQSIDVNLVNWTDNKVSLVDFDTLVLKELIFTIDSNANKTNLIQHNRNFENAINKLSKCLEKWSLDIPIYTTINEFIFTWKCTKKKFKFERDF